MSRVLSRKLVESVQDRIDHLVHVFYHREIGGAARPNPIGRQRYFEIPGGEEAGDIRQPPRKADARHLHPRRRNAFCLFEPSRSRKRKARESTWECPKGGSHNCSTLDSGSETSCSESSFERERRAANWYKNSRIGFRRRRVRPGLACARADRPNNP